MLDFPYRRAVQDGWILSICATLSTTTNICPGCALSGAFVQSVNDVNELFMKSFLQADKWLLVMNCAEMKLIDNVIFLDIPVFFLADRKKIWIIADVMSDDSDGYGGVLWRSLQTHGQTDGSMLKIKSIVNKEHLDYLQKGTGFFYINGLVYRWHQIYSLECRPPHILANGNGTNC